MHSDCAAAIGDHERTPSGMHCDRLRVSLSQAVAVCCAVKRASHTSGPSDTCPPEQERDTAATTTPTAVIEHVPGSKSLLKFTCLTSTKVQRLTLTRGSQAETQACHSTWPPRLFAGASTSPSLPLPLGEGKERKRWGAQGWGGLRLGEGKEW
jgi:hypothetical protein